MRVLILLLLLPLGHSVHAQSINFGNNARIYLVRHAEKLTGQDPLLTENGNKRAGDLMRVLKDKPIRHIYVTEYRRTQNTGDSLRLQQGIDTVHYGSDTSCVDLFQKILANADTKGSILIIGHSNTIPTIIRKLGIVNYPLDDIPSPAFDNLFIIRYKKGQPFLKKTTYGAASGPADAMK
jgi:broad specificity phosphatase PhoE